MSDEDFKRNELVVRGGQRTAVGDKWLDIRDNGGPVSFVDIITEARHNNGVFASRLAPPLWTETTVASATSPAACI
ncbi:hypothetical protein IB244_22730 [Rhizobium sp. RHZ02]|uniref:hypothetical protein n=1 Tax=Rhizobium sp. RHZ02 TaxID=2769306 RepID=UPI00177BB5C0|nr:hypothetical protein [Rhizobium sp. RHZ02]MBD9454321.1 hypothetical protein [Rhizobium sp. RHZ02]